LGVHCVTAKFVPGILTADQKHQRVNARKELRQIAFDDAAFLSKVITGEESWIYCYDPETKQQPSQWKSPNSLNSLTPKKVRHVKSKVESILTFFFFFDIKGLFTKNLSWQVKQSFPII
jgi:hypothetical protein